MMQSSTAMQAQNEQAQCPDPGVPCSACANSAVARLVMRLLNQQYSVSAAPEDMLIKGVCCKISVLSALAYDEAQEAQAQICTD